MLQLGGSGGISLEYFFEVIFDDAPWGPDNRVLTPTHSAHCVVMTGTGQFSDHSLISHTTSFAGEACETIIVHLEERKVVGRL